MSFRLVNVTFNSIQLNQEHCCLCYWLFLILFYRKRFNERSYLRRPFMLWNDYNQEVWWRGLLFYYKRQVQCVFQIMFLGRCECHRIVCLYILNNMLRSWMFIQNIIHLYWSADRIVSPWSRVEHYINSSGQTLNCHRSNQHIRHNCFRSLTSWIQGK